MVKLSKPYGIIKLGCFNVTWSDLYLRFGYTWKTKENGLTVIHGKCLTIKK